MVYVRDVVGFHSSTTFCCQILSIPQSNNQPTYQQPNPPIHQSIQFIQFIQFNNQYFAFSTQKINLFQQKTTNQSITKLIPFKNLSLKKKRANSATAAFSHTHTTSYLCYELSTINTITQKGVISTT